MVLGRLFPSLPPIAAAMELLWGWGGVSSSSRRCFFSAFFLRDRVYTVHFLGIRQRFKFFSF